MWNEEKRKARKKRNGFPSLETNSIQVLRTYYERIEYRVLDLAIWRCTVRWSPTEYERKNTPKNNE